MLVIGDAAIRELKQDHNILNVEIIGSGEQEGFISNTLNASKHPKILNRYSKSFDIKHSRKLLFYNYNELGILEQMTDYTFSKKWQYVFAPAKLLYVLEMVKITELFHNVYYWEKAVKNFNYLLRNHILPMKKQDDRLLKKLELYSTKFYHFILSSELINDEYYSYREFDVVSENDLYNIYTFNDKKNFNNVSYASNRSELQETIWKNYSIEDKIGCVLERAYTVAINEFVIPYWIENKKMPLNSRELFKESLMIITSTTSTDWFAMFIVSHYNVILSKFNKYFISIFSNALKYGDIETIN